MTALSGRERGAALVTTLLAVTLLMLVVVEFTYSTQIDTHLAANGLKVLQASYLARSGVNLARLLLRDDARQSGVDSLGERWAQVLPPLPAGEGLVRLRLSDEQGKLNVNALRNADGTINWRWRETAERLFELRGIEIAVLEPLLDWLDSDDFPEPRGAESAAYAARTPPYTARNGPLLTFSELSRVEGITPALRAQLSEIVTVLPHRQTKINVNTAAPELLRALFPHLAPGLVAEFVNERLARPVRGANDLIDRLGLDAREHADSLRMTAVRTDFFRATVVAAVAPVTQAVTAILHRQGTRVSLVAWQPAFTFDLQGGAPG